MERPLPEQLAHVHGGLPNPTLLTETADLSPGRALEIGCGEGADALWLAEHGWQITATDIAPTALRRAAQTPSPAAHRVTWVESDLTDEMPVDGPFDLVTMHYLPLTNGAADQMLPGLLEKVASGGTFLFVTHDVDDLEPRHDVDPHRYSQPDDIAARLGVGWTVVLNEKRPREGTAQSGSAHTHDVILRAERESGLG